MLQHFYFDKILGFQTKILSFKGVYAVKLAKLS